MILNGGVDSDKCTYIFNILIFMLGLVWCLEKNLLCIFWKCQSRTSISHRVVNTLAHSHPLSEALGQILTLLLSMKLPTNVHSEEQHMVTQVLGLLPFQQETWTDSPPPGC